jgi:hypothetical protein
MAGNPMISVCVRLRHIYSHIQICTRNEALKLFEDMFSVDFLRTEQGSAPRVIISYSAVIHRKLSLQTGIICSSFLQISEYSSGTSQYQYRVCQLQVHQKTRSSYHVRAFQIQA